MCDDHAHAHAGIWLFCECVLIWAYLVTLL